MLSPAFKTNWDFPIYAQLALEIWAFVHSRIVPLLAFNLHLNNVKIVLNNIAFPERLFVLVSRHGRYRNETACCAKVTQMLSMLELFYIELSGVVRYLLRFFFLEFKVVILNKYIFLVLENFGTLYAQAQKFKN